MTQEEAIAVIVKAFAQRPASAYIPGRVVDLDGKEIDPLDNGQLQFHKSLHAVRYMAPGNGWGKTAAMAVEVDWWGHGDHPYQPVPKEPRVMVWICPTHGQWEKIRKDIEAWWPRGVVSSWVGPPRYCYTWLDGSQLFLITSETDEHDVQGIQPHLVSGDETFPAPLWNEMVKRRRGRRHTRYNIGATQTEGITWMYKELYLPWLAWHEKEGISDELEMMRVQSHRYADPALADMPGIWCWPQGSHRENPTATKAAWAWYLANTPGHPAERHVRLYGGHRDFAGTPVFDPEQLEEMRKDLRDGVTGGLVTIEAM